MKLLPYLKKQWINRSQNMDYNNNNEPLQFIKLNNVNKNLNLDDKEYESLLLEYDEKVKNKDKPLCLEKKELDKTKNLEEKKEFLEKNEEILIFNLKYIKTSSITNKQVRN